MKNELSMGLLQHIKHTNLLLISLRASVLCMAFLMLGCGTTKKAPQTVVKMQPAKVSQQATPTALGNVEFHTSEFADELFGTFRYRAKARNQFRFAVATFVPVDSLQVNPNHNHHLELLGHQLEQGMMTELARRGYIAQDYKATNDIIIEDTADRVFSRNVDELYAHHHNIDFYLSGTISETEKGAIVNARIIHVETKDVVAAATRYFPAELFWSEGKVTTRGGMIYRTTD